MRGFLTPALALLALLATVAAKPQSGDGSNGSGVDGGALGQEECQKATAEVWHLPYPGDCTRFITCNTLGGLSTIYTCDSPLYFNPSIQTCDWPENVDCVPAPDPDPATTTIKTTTTTTTIAPTTTTTKPTTTKKPDESGGCGESSESPSCSESSEPDPCEKSKPSCESSSGDCGGSSEPDPVDPVDPDPGSSEPVEPVDPPVDPNDYCIGATADRYHFPHPTDPTLFYKCELTTGIAHLFECPDNLLWNDEYQTCAYSATRNQLVLAPLDAAKLLRVKHLKR